MEDDPLTATLLDPDPLEPLELTPEVVDVDPYVCELDVPDIPYVPEELDDQLDYEDWAPEEDDDELDAWLAYKVVTSPKFTSLLIVLPAESVAVILIM